MDWPTDFARDESHPGDNPVSTSGEKRVSDMTEAEFDVWLETLPPTPDLSSTPEAIEAAEKRAMADYREGRWHSHETVSKWLRTWPSANYKPFKEWLKSSG